MIKVLKSGFFTTIQDKGRFGFRQYGVPVSGAMDTYSSNFANALLGNLADCATLEMTMVGATFQFLKTTKVAISGALMQPKLNDLPIEMNSVIIIKANDVLSFDKVEKGYRTYLAIKNGFKAESVFGSRSQYKGMTKIWRLSVNDSIDYDENIADFKNANAQVKYDHSILDSNNLEVYKGPEFDELSEDNKYLLFNSKFKVSKLNSRMAYQLEPLLENSLKSILTSPVLPGTVQLTPKGQLIVLMRDCQTTGGYPRILQLSKKSINCLSQKMTSNAVGFKEKMQRM